MKKLKIVLISIAMFLFVLTSLAPQAVLAAGFLKIQGIEGEATDKAHESWIEIASYNLGLSSAADASSASGRSGSGSITITKYADKATSVLKSQVNSKASLPKAVLHVQRQDGKSGYMIYEFENALVTSYTPGGSGGVDRPTENVTLNFSSVTWTYVPGDSGARSGEVNSGWDIETNEPD